MNTIRFQFRCSAFGVHYWDLITRDQTVEVCHTGMTINCPEIKACHVYEQLPEGAIDAWKQHCQEERQRWEQWKAEHPACLPYCQEIDKDVIY